MKTRTIVTVARCARVTTFGFVSRDVRAFDAAALDASALASSERRVRGARSRVRRDADDSRVLVGDAKNTQRDASSDVAQATSPRAKSS